LGLLQRAGLVEKRHNDSGPNTTEYHLTQAGLEVKPVVGALIEWGAMWAFAEPTPDELDPTLLLWWMHDRVNSEKLPQERVVIEFNFYGAAEGLYWLVITCDKTSVCLKPPGFDIDIIVRSDIAVFYKLWLGRISYIEAISDDGVVMDGPPHLIQAFPEWFAWSLTAPAVRQARSRQNEQQP
jgi:hypothetical protein